MRWNALGTLALAGALLATSAPATAQEDDASSTPGPMQTPLTVESGRPDLYLEMPDDLGGFEPEIVMTRGEEHLANLGADDQTRRELESMLEALGADISDMVSGYALVSQEDFFSFVVAIRVEGVTPGTLSPAYLPILYEDLLDPESSVGEMGGKDVVVIASRGSDDQYVELYVYDEGDTIWMLQGPSEVVETTLADLPEPLPAE